MGVRSSRWVLLVSLLGCVAALVVAMLVGTPSDAVEGGQAVASVPPAPVTGGELTSLRTASSRTYARSDGSRATRVWAQPVNFKDAAGDWEAIDTSLRRDGGGDLQTMASEAPVTLPGSLGDAAKVSDGARSVSFSLDGASPAEATASGSTATYDDALPGVDATYEAQPLGVKETLTLADASAPATFRFDLSASAGLRPDLADGGSVIFRDGEGARRFVLPSPTVQEDGAQPTAAHVAYRLSEDGETLTVAVDPDWLASARFPVQVDPSVWKYGTVGCTLSSAAPSTASCNTSTLSVGHSASGTQRAVLRFADIGTIDPTASIVDAQLFLNVASTSGTGNPVVDVYGLTPHQPTASATWNTYDGSNAWTSAGGDVAASAEDTSADTLTAPGATAYLDVSPLAQQWVRNSSANFGVLVRLHDETALNGVTFKGLTTGTDAPALEIDWLAHPGSERDGTYESMGIDDRSGLSVNAATGNLAVSSTDINLPGVAGNDVALGRTYNSTEATDTSVAINGETKQYGAGWTWTLDGFGLYSVYVWPDNTRTIIGAGGAVYRFDRNPAKDTSTDLGYDTPSGIDADLTVSKADNTSKLTLRQSGAVVRWGVPDNQAQATLSSITDRHGNATSVTYRADRQVDQITDTYGHHLTFNYSAGGRLQTITGPSSRTWTYHLGSSGTATVLSSFNDPDLNATSYAYDTASSSVPARINKITDARGHDIRLRFGTGADAGRVTSITRVVDGTATNDVTTTFAYNPSTGGTACTASGVIGRTVVTDPLGHQTTYCYNVNGQVVQTFDARGRSVATSYNSAGNVATFTGLAGTGNPSLTNYSFNSAGSTTGSSTAVGSATKSTALNYCTDGGTQPACTTATNSKYNPTQFTDSQGTITTLGYNGTGDLTDVQSGSGTSDHQRIDYNTDGTIARTTDGLSHQTTYGYDASHFLTTVTQPVPLAVENFTPDASERVATAGATGASTQTITYDGEDRTRTVAYSGTGGVTFTFTYDGDGNVIKRLDSLGNETDYTYDNLNRRLTEYFSSGGTTNTYTYDKAGNLKSIVDHDGTTSYAYDEINRLTTVTSPRVGGGTDDITFTYTDPAGSTDPSIQTTTYPGGLRQQSTTDAAGDVLAVHVLNGSTVLKARDYTYTYGSGSSRVSDLIQTMTDEAGNVTTYRPSGPNRLGEAKTMNGSTPVEDWVYAYDAAGNRTSRTHQTGAGTPSTVSYAYNAANQMCWSIAGTSPGSCSCPTITSCTTPPTGATVYAYDVLGQRTTSTPAMAWDREQRLSTLAGTPVYNLAPIGNGELIGYGSTGYQNNLLGLSRIIPSSGTATDVIRTPAGGAVAQRAGTTSKQAIFTDALGSTIALADANGTSITRNYAYTPDGVATTTGTGATTDLQFAGGHSIASLYHYGARYYDPNLATWTQPDPLNQIDSLTEANRYAYAGGNPVDNVDPTGCGVSGCVRHCAFVHCGDTGKVYNCLANAHSTPAFVRCLLGFCNSWKLTKCLVGCGVDMVNAGSIISSIF